MTRRTRPGANVRRQNLIKPVPRRNAARAKGKEKRFVFRFLFRLRVRHSAAIRLATTTYRLDTARGQCTMFYRDAVLYVHIILSSRRHSENSYVYTVVRYRRGNTLPCYKIKYCTTEIREKSARTGKARDNIIILLSIVVRAAEKRGNE